MKEVKPPPDREMIKRLTFDNMFLLYYNSHYNTITCSRMAMAIAFSRQNDAGHARAYALLVCENIVPVVVLILDS